MLKVIILLDFCGKFSRNPLQIKKMLYLCDTKKENLSVAMHSTCGVNLEDFFYSIGSIAVIEYCIFFAFFFCLVTPTSILTFSK